MGVKLGVIQQDLLAALHVMCVSITRSGSSSRVVPAGVSMQRQSASCQAARKAFDEVEHLEQDEVRRRRLLRCC